MMIGVATLLAHAVDDRFEQPGLMVDYIGKLLQTYLRTGFLQQRVGYRGRPVLAIKCHAMRPSDQKFRL